MGATGQYYHFGLPFKCFVIKRGNMGSFTPGPINTGTFVIPLPGKESLFLIPDGLALLINLLVGATVIWLVEHIGVVVRRFSSRKKLPSSSVK